MSSYIVYDPGTGTIVAAEDSVLVNIVHLPDNPEEWEVYLAENEVPCLDIQPMIDTVFGNSRTE